MNKIALILAGGTPSPSGAASAPDSGAFKDMIQSSMSEGLEADITEWSRQPSSHYTVRLTTDLLELLRSKAKEGYEGIVVICGTDAMEEIAYLADLLWTYPQPIIFSEINHVLLSLGGGGIFGLKQSLTAALSPKLQNAGVIIYSGGELFAAKDVARISNYKDNDFGSLGNGPIGRIILGDVHLNYLPKRPLKISDTVIPVREIEILSSSIGGGEAIISALTKHDGLCGLVISAFGSGNVLPSWIPHIRTILRKKIPIAIASRCYLGRIFPLSNFESSAAKLIEMGVMSAGDLSPLQARLRLSVALGAGLEGQTLHRYLRNDE